MTLEDEFSEVTRRLHTKRLILERISGTTLSALRERLRKEIDWLETREIELYLMIEA